MNITASHRFAAVVCLAALAAFAAPSVAAVTLDANDSSLTADVVLTVSPDTEDGHDTVGPGLVGADSADVAELILGDTSGEAHAPMILVINSGLGGFTGLSAASGGPTLGAVVTASAAASVAQADAVARLDVTFTVAPGDAYDFALAITTSGIMSASPQWPPMAMTVSLSGTSVSDSWQAQPGSPPPAAPETRNYAGALGAGTYQLVVVAETHALADFQMPVTSTGDYDVQFALTEVPEPTSVAILAVGAVLAVRRRRRR